MAEFFSTLVPSGPGNLGSLATQAAAGMVSFGGATSSSPVDDSSSPTSGSSGDQSDSSPSKVTAAMPSSGAAAFFAPHGNVFQTSSSPMLLTSSPAFTFPQFAPAMVTLPNGAFPSVVQPMHNPFDNQTASVLTGHSNINDSPEGLGMDDDGDDDDDLLGGGRRGSTQSASGKTGLQKSGSSGPGGSGQRQSLTTAERRATHNAIERARRESLNGRFMQLAASLPSMANVKRPSKSIIVNKSLEYIQESVIREHALVKENSDLRREVDELRARLGMPPLPPSTPAGFAHGLPAIAPPQLISHLAAPGAATIPPELPPHAALAFRPAAYGLPPGTPMHIPLRPHPHHPGLLTHIPGFSFHPDAAAMLSPGLMHAPQMAPQPMIVPQPILREDSFDQTRASLSQPYAGAIMGNPPAMTSPPVKSPTSLFTAAGSMPLSESKKRPSPEADEQMGSNKKRAVSDEKTKAGEDSSANKIVRSGSISSESSTSSASASSQQAANASPFSDASSLSQLASQHSHSLSALGIEVPISQAFGHAMTGLGLMPLQSAGTDAAPLFHPVSSQPWAGLEGVSTAAGGNPFALL